MSQSRDRVRRLLVSELDECCEGDVDSRLAELEALGEAAIPDEAELARESARFAVLGNETRLRLVRYLVAAERDLCVCELEELVDVSASAVSHALADLTEAGLLTREKRGKWRYYGATERAATLVAAVGERDV